MTYRWIDLFIQKVLWQDCVLCFKLSMLIDRNVSLQEKSLTPELTRPLHKRKPDPMSSQGAKFRVQVMKTLTPPSPSRTAFK
jgi:hypothetical protein